MRLLPPRKRKRADRARRAGPPLRLCFLQRCGAEDSCSAGLPSHLRRFPLKYKTRLASAESTDPKRDRLVESHLSRNERWATPPHRQGSLLSHSIFAEQMPGFAVGVPQSRARWNRSGWPQSQNGTVADGPNGQNKPCLFRDDVSHQKINFGRLVGDCLAA